MISRLLLACSILLLPTVARGQQPARDTLAEVVGVVIDSVGLHPLAGATVQLVAEGEGAAAFNAVTDSLGSYRIANLPPGRYLAGFFHQALEDLALEQPLLRVELGSGRQVLNLSTPPARRVLDATCPAATRPDSTGVLVGRVSDAESGAPLANATVQVQWFEVLIDKGLRQVRRAGSARTDDRGLYAICGIPADGSVSVFASADGLQSGVVEAEVPAAGVLRQSILLSRRNATVAITDSIDAPARGDSAATKPTFLRGSARLRGVVRDVEEDKPIAGARVSVRGSGLSAVTREDGSFTLGELPGGTQTLDVRAIGFGPRALPVELRNGDELRMNLELDRRIVQLEAVKVFGRAPNMTPLAERKRRGMGHVLTQADIAKMRPFDIVDVFRRIPSVRLVLSPTGHALRFRDCTPSVWLNGMQVSAGTEAPGFAVPGGAAMAGGIDMGNDLELLVPDPRTITGIEVYAPHATPIQYAIGNRCGTVLIWSGIPPR